MTQTPTITRKMTQNIHIANNDHTAHMPATSTNQSANPFTLYQKNLAPTASQPVQWLWQNRLPLAGITLLDGDHGLGKSLLALQIAAAVSSGKPMPDGSPTIQGGVIIITPFTDASTTQLQQLISLGANMEHVEFLSFIHDPASRTSQAHTLTTSGHRSFSLPEDLTRLVEAIERVNARLIILDPFIYLLSRHLRYTNLRLSHLLTELEQLLLDRNIACLLVRNCRAKGGHAKPSALEKSDHFSTIAVSRLLLAPDPVQPEHILLSHALSRHCPLTQTLTLQIQPLPAHPDLPHITIHGYHILKAAHLLTLRPDTLHRQLLSKLILAFLTQSPEPVHATTLYTFFHQSSPSQIQRTLKDLLLTGQIQRPTRGFYYACPTTPELNFTAATTVAPIAARKLDSPAATTPQLKAPAATTADPTCARKLEASAATTSNPTVTTKLKAPATTTPITTTKLNSPAATTSTSTIATKLNSPAATTPSSKPVRKLETTAATTSKPTVTTNFTATIATLTAARKLEAPAATASAKKLKAIVATTPNSKVPRPHKHLHKKNKSHGRPR